MTDLNDFFAQHPVPQPPPEEVKRDPVLDAIGETTATHAAGTPFRGRGRSMQLVDRTVCRFPCQVPGHNHVAPIFRPEPELDEAGVGWTVQHVPTDFTRHHVPKRCVLCAEECDDLREHVCQVEAVLYG